MRWLEYSFKCCGETEQGCIPAFERTDIRCWICHKYQSPPFFNLQIDDLEYEDYLAELYGDEEFDDEDEDFDWEE